MRLLAKYLICVGLSVALFATFAAASENTSKRERKAQEAVKITVVPWGPTQAMVDAAKLRVEQSDAVRSILKGAKYRILAFEYVENSSGAKSQA